MTPGSYDFRIPRGATPFLAVRLTGRDPVSGQIARLPVPGLTIEWTVEWPSGSETKASTDMAQGLTVDRRTGMIIYPISAAHAGELAAAPAPIALRIRYVASDGYVCPLLTGTVELEG